MSQVPFGYVFAAELHDRLLWFGRLRWIAVSVIAVAVLIGWAFGIGEQWPAIAVLGIVVAAYNYFFSRRLQGSAVESTDYATLRSCAIRQMVADLATILGAVHFTGGWQSPVLPFVVFHMAIGTIMISTRIMYVLAALTCSGAVVLFGLEHSGVLPAVALPAGPLLAGSWFPSALSLVVVAFGIVYLTHTVTSRFKIRNIELHEATTALEERTEELEVMVAEKAELQHQKSHYLRISAHQLRSPLATIKTSLQVMNEGYVDPSSPEGKSLSAGAVRRVEGLIDIVNDLLEMAKIREGRNKAPWVEQVNLSQILADIFDATTVYAEENGVELVPAFTGQPSVILDWGVPPDLVFAFENLIHNAVKYSKAEGGSVVVDHHSDGQRAEITVEDSGIGIPEELQQEIFLEFIRAPNAKKRAAEGTGLGLSIVREACLLHDGSIRVESTINVGSRFIVDLPVHVVPPPEALNGRVTPQ